MQCGNALMELQLGADSPISRSSKLRPAIKISVGSHYTAIIYHNVYVCTYRIICMYRSYIVNYNSLGRCHSQSLLNVTDLPTRACSNHACESEFLCDPKTLGTTNT